MVLIVWEGQDQAGASQSLSTAALHVFTRGFERLSSGRVERSPEDDNLVMPYHAVADLIISPRPRHIFPCKGYVYLEFNEFWQALTF